MQYAKNTRVLYHIWSLYALHGYSDPQSLWKEVKEKYMQFGIQFKSGKLEYLYQNRRQKVNSGERSGGGGDLSGDPIFLFPIYPIFTSVNYHINKFVYIARVLVL